MVVSVEFSDHPPAAALTQGQQESATLPAPTVDEIGLYYLKDSHWVEVPPEVVNWKTGGVVKHVSTLGIIKQDINARISKPSSHTKIFGLATLLVYAPEGTAITEYQLIRLRHHAESREFRNVTGGVFHESGGAERDAVDFTGVRVAKRTWTISLGVLTPGEYGILAPGLNEARGASSQLGKMYTFSVPE